MYIIADVRITLNRCNSIQLTYPSCGTKNAAWLTVRPHEQVALDDGLYWHDSSVEHENWGAASETLAKSCWSLENDAPMPFADSLFDLGDGGFLARS
jgi:hypothetical protein